MPLPSQSGLSRLISRESGVSILGPWAVISQLDETHANLQTGVVEMLQF